MSGFYGESYALNWLRVDRGCAGMSERGNDMYYHFDGLSDTFVPGDAFTVEAWVDPRELTADDEVTVSWVLELGPATNGTVRLSAGLDPTWNADRAYATQPLGEHTVVGAQTLVAGPVAVTAASLAAWADDIIGHVECLAGMLEIVQIKLRVWPPQGAGGAWVPAPAATVTGGASLHRLLGATHPGGSQYIGGYGEAEGSDRDQVIEEAIHLSAAALRANNIGQVRYVVDRQQGRPMIATASYDVSIGSFVFDPPWWRVSAGTHKWPGFLVADPRLWPMPPRLGIDPNEISDETTASVRGPDGGPPLGEFAGWDGAVAVEYFGTAVEPAVLEQHPLAQNPVTVDDGRGAIYEDYTGGIATAVHAAPGTTTRVDVPIELSSPVVALVPRVPGLNGDSATPADPAQELAVASLSVYPSSAGLRYEVAYGSYLWFDPSIPTQAPRFFVKDHDDQWHAVGPGKPATDPAIFKVKTAAGWYREPRHGEDVAGTGAHPLKVKVRDGSGPEVWDTVAWLTPLD